MAETSVRSETDAAERRARPSRLVVLSALLGVVAACVGAPTEAYRAFDAATADESSLATLELSRADSVVIDSTWYVDAAKYRAVRVAPGRHRIETRTTFGVSVAVDARMVVGRAATEFPVFAAGHTYRIAANRTTGPGYQTFLWIEDAADGRVVAGTRQP